MRGLWSIILTSVLINVYGAMEPQEPLTFNVMAETDVITPGNRAQSVCRIESAQSNGSGVLFSLDGKVAVLTAAHIQSPRAVHFLIMNNQVEPPRLESLKFDVLQAIPMKSDLRSLTAQTDLQVLFVSGNPEKRVSPLQLTSQIDKSKSLTIYGFGTICAEFVKGQLSTGIPIVNGTYRLSKVSLPKFTIDPKASALNHAHNLLARQFHRFGMLHCVIPMRITPTSSEIEGIIQATTQYDPESLQTHIGQGFSGGAALQGNNVVGICHSCSLNITNRTISEITKLSQGSILAMWGSYFLGMKIPMLQSISPWLGDPVLSPLIKWTLEKFGHNPLSSPLRMCAFNTGVFLLMKLLEKAYIRSNHALQKPKQAWFVRLTPGVIDWIRTVLNNPQTSTAAS